jgi:hypothetical protein
MRTGASSELRRDAVVDEAVDAFAGAVPGETGIGAFALVKVGIGALVAGPNGTGMLVGAAVIGTGVFIFTGAFIDAFIGGNPAGDVGGIPKGTFDGGGVGCGIGLGVNGGCDGIGCGGIGCGGVNAGCEPKEGGEPNCGAG